MHKEILSEKQKELLPLIRQFSREYYLAGGTAVALHIGHRRSIDFDLFKFSSVNHKKNIDKIAGSRLPYEVTWRETGQMNVTVGDVKVTFLEYPFHISPKRKFENIIKIPELIDLAAMKAYALGRRSKWKDYVDLYFILKNNFSIGQISARASEIFDQLFSEKLFRSQLNYFDDIDYSESVDYVDTAIPEEQIRAFLTEKSLEVKI
ncbi:MAG: nucleotidyl transferase AbiEii/AbiGii toxin family protein [Bacteroidales bacterium]|nr:nucleotidyl transferase AbiEii/AbiGii toxin family protein [Bacteroidales bacterium]